MKKIIEFSIIKSKILNSNVKLHHFIKSERAAYIRDLARTKSAQELEIPFNKFMITVYVKSPTRRRIDPANLYPTIKPIIDGMTDSGWWEDDDYKHLDEIRFRYGGLSKEKGFFDFVLEITEIEEEQNENNTGN